MRRERLTSHRRSRRVEVPAQTSEQRARSALSATLAAWRRRRRRRGGEVATARIGEIVDLRLLRPDVVFASTDGDPSCLQRRVVSSCPRRWSSRRGRRAGCLRAGSPSGAGGYRLFSRIRSLRLVAGQDGASGTLRCFRSRHRQEDPQGESRAQSRFATRAWVGGDGWSLSGRRTARRWSVK